MTTTRKAAIRAGARRSVGTQPRRGSDADGSVAAALMKEIDALRSDLRRTLADMPTAAIGKRSPTGDWSALENLRHLLFAEQLHTRSLFAGKPDWSALGFTPETMRVRRTLPPLERPRPTAAEVWTAWDLVHAATARRLRDDATGAVAVLDRNLRHLRAHANVIKRLARQAATAAVGTSASAAKSSDGPDQATR